MMPKLSLVLALCAAASLPALPASAQWRPTGVPVATALLDQSAAVTASDGAGGMYVVWQDYRNSGVNNGLFDIYAQHVLATGVPDPAWAADGIPVCALTDTQIKPSVMADGAGGAFVTWIDHRNGTNNVAYMTHLTTSGVDAAWPANGTRLTDANGVIDWELQMVSDGGTGVLTLGAVFLGYRDVRVQHVYANGALDPNFTAAGVRAGVVDYWGNRGESLTSDGAGGAIVAWQTGGAKIYGMRVLASGATDSRWPAGGRIVQSTGLSGQYPTAIADGAGGAVIVWSQTADVSYEQDIYAQHVFADGTFDPAWPADGLPVCAVTGGQQTARVVSDGAGGVFAAWSDLRIPGDFDVYVQHVRAGGDVDPAWPAGGRALCTLPSTQFAMSALADGAGGAIVLWNDTGSNRRGLYAQRVGANGAVSAGWPAGGAVVTGFVSGYVYPGASIDAAGNALVAWNEYRKGNPSPRSLDVYSRRMPRAGTHRLTTSQGTGTAAYVLVPDSLNIFWAQQSSLSGFDMTADDEIEFRFPSFPNQSLVSVTANGLAREVAPNHVIRNLTQDVALEATWSYDPWTITTHTAGGTAYAALGWPMTYAKDSVSTLLDELWPTDDRKWRLARWNPTTAAYDLATESLTRIQPGQGYWLATRAPHTVAVAGRPLYLPTTDVPLLGDAASGWNQIANPYRFPIADTALRVISGATVAPFTGAANTYTDSTVWEWTSGTSYVIAHTLLPNRGYWVRKRAAGAVSLRFPNLTSTRGTAAAPVRPADAEWAVTITAGQGESRTTAVTLGAWQGAAASAPLRRESPPDSPAGGLRLSVADAAESRVREQEAFVGANAPRVWQLALAGAEAPGEVTLDLEGFDLPADLWFELRDPALGWSRAVRPGERVTLAATPGPRRLSLEAREGAMAPTGEESPRLLAAWPNPFRRQLGFTAQLSAAGDIRVDIMDVQGRVVRTLERRGAPAGESVILWDGRGVHGDAVRPGVYLARWRAAGREGAVRLVKLD